MTNLLDPCPNGPPGPHPPRAHVSSSPAVFGLPDLALMSASAQPPSGLLPPNWLLLHAPPLPATHPHFTRPCPIRPPTTACPAPLTAFTCRLHPGFASPSCISPSSPLFSSHSSPTSSAAPSWFHTRNLAMLHSHLSSLAASCYPCRRAPSASSLLLPLAGLGRAYPGREQILPGLRLFWFKRSSWHYVGVRKSQDPWARPT